MIGSKRNNQLIVTTSWDDGHVSDLRVLNLLEKYNLVGTFYIPKFFPLIKSLSDDDVRLIAQTQEIGAHTINHHYLAKLDTETVRQEIFESKKYIQQLIGREPEIFGYPGGSFDEQAKNLAQAAGFIGARTVTDIKFMAPLNNFEFDSTLHVYPFPLKTKGKSLKLTIYQLFAPLQHHKLARLRALSLPISSYFGWKNLAKSLFDFCLKNGDYFHLWGHSFELDRYNMWRDLEDVFKYISHRPDCSYKTNSETLKILKNK